MKKDIEDQRLVLEDEKKAPRMVRDETQAHESKKAKEVMKKREEDCKHLVCSSISGIVFSGSVKVSIKLLTSDLHSGPAKAPDI